MGLGILLARPIKAGFLTNFLFWAGDGRACERGLIREAESPVDRVGAVSHLKPLQQSFSLWVVGEFMERNWNGGVCKDLHWVARLQIVLADSARL